MLFFEQNHEQWQQLGVVLLGVVLLVPKGNFVFLEQALDVANVAHGLGFAQAVVVHEIRLFGVAFGLGLLAQQFGRLVGLAQANIAQRKEKLAQAGVKTGDQLDGGSLLGDNT